MSKSRIVSNDLGGLNTLVRGLMAMEGHKHVVKIGILGSKTNRFAAAGLKKTGGHRVKKGDDAALTNAELGMVHELGSFSRGIPARSFLRLPLFQKAAQIVREGSAGAMERLRKGDVLGLLKRFGIACENAVQDAFGSRGFGRWAPDSAATAKAKKSDAPLIDTAQLRKSITSKVETLA